MPCLHPRSFGSSVKKNKKYGTIFGGTDEGFLIHGLIVGGGVMLGERGGGIGWVWGGIGWVWGGLGYVYGLTEFLQLY